MTKEQRRQPPRPAVRPPGRFSKPAPSLVARRSLLICGIFAASANLADADQTKANNNNNLESGSSWVSGTAPTTNDNAIWNSTVATPANCTNTLGSAVAWNGITILNPSAPVTIYGNTTLTLNNGINMSNAAVDLVIGCGTINLGSNQVWAVPTGRNLVTGSSTNSGSVNSPNNGNLIVTKNGGGTWTTGGTGDNGSTGIIINGGTVNLNKTSNSRTHAVGGPGLIVNSGGIARVSGTGPYQIYDQATVTLAGGLFDLGGNNEIFAGLTGTGVVDNQAAGSSATLILSNGTSIFSGIIQNSGSGAALTLVKSGTGTLTLDGTNSHTGGTIVNGGTLTLAATFYVPMPYTVNGGVLSVTADTSGGSLPMDGLILGGNGPQLTFNLGGARNLVWPLITNSGILTVNGNVVVNVQNVAQSGTYVLLRYSTRSGAGGFVAGTMPAGAAITDDTTNDEVILTYSSLLEPRLIVPVYNTNEVVVAVATPQQYGAVADGVTDDSGAFQNAMNAVYNFGGAGGGVVYVPPGNYAFYTNIVIPTGVTLHGDWTDWTQSTNGVLGTVFKIYFGAGQTSNTPFIAMNISSGLRDVNIWYPNQNPNVIVPYPFTIGVGSDSVIQRVALVNSYQGIESYNGGDKHILSTIVGTPLYKGIALDQIFDVCHAEDIRFSPYIWPASGLTNAPAVGGSYAAWMRTNGEAMHLLRVDGEMCMNTYISGYSVGFEANAATNGQPGVTFYCGAITNCGTALLAQDMPGAFGLMFANFTLDGDIAILRTNTADDANAMFDHCTIIGRNGPAVSVTGADWHSWMQFEDCTISNSLDLAGPGVFNVVDSTLLGSTQCVLNANATRAAFSGCAFAPAQNIVNQGNAGNLIIDSRPSVSNAFPIVYWTNVANQLQSCRPALTNLYTATDTQWGAYGDGMHDDTVAIQGALTAAGTNGGGIVYLPAGQYHLTNTLQVPPGVQLRGSYELRHGTWPGADNVEKGTVLEPYGGQGTTDGPPAVVIEPDAGLVGVTICYESQSTNCLPFPPAIQGRGGNVYAIGVCSPNPYWYVDLDTYNCTNHFIDMVDGWALHTGYKIGNGSSGTVADCHCNWTYWVENFALGQNQLPGSIQAPVLNFVAHNLQMYVLGNCSEKMVKDFSIIENEFMHCVDERNEGPAVTLINTYCDATIQAFVLDAAGPCAVAAVNTPMTTFNFGNYGDLAQSTVGVLSTTNFQGVARFISSVLWGGTYLDFNVGGGDVGMEMVHSDEGSQAGSVVHGGVFHLINYSAGIGGTQTYNVLLGGNAGLPGKTNEFIACFAYNGCSYINAATNPNPENVWNDYALSGYSLLNPNLPGVYGQYPNNSGLFEYTNVLAFGVAAPEGAAASNIVLYLNGVVVTNLAFSGSSNSWFVSYPFLAVNAFYSVVIKVTDTDGDTFFYTNSFDTFNPATYTFEAEDWDATVSGTSGIFIDNPQTNAYADLGSTGGIDLTNSILGQGNSSYRPQGLETEDAGDVPRPAYMGTGYVDYDVGFNSGGSGNWGNYTRHYPAGIYYIYMRAASPNGDAVTADSASLSQVVSGFGTSSQTTANSGTFSIPNTGGWQNYTWVPLENAQGSMVQITNSGSVKTLRITTVNGGYNANFYALVPVSISPNPASLAVALEHGGVVVSFPTQVGFSYQMEYKSTLTAANWAPVGTLVPGNNLVQAVNEPLGSSGFYRVEIQPNKSY
jgi:autotransporter-associated beta strand protein